MEFQHLSNSSVTAMATAAITELSDRLAASVGQPDTQMLMPQQLAIMTSWEPVPTGVAAQEFNNKSSAELNKKNLREGSLFDNTPTEDDEGFEIIRRRRVVVDGCSIIRLHQDYSTNKGSPSPD